MQTTDQHVLGIDIGGSHITAGLVNIKAFTLDDNTVVRLRVDSHAPARDIIHNWSEAINSVWEKAGTGPTRIGIAMPGPFDYANGISLIDKQFHKYEALFRLNVRNMLAESAGIPSSHVLMRNDAEAFLEGEVLGGAARGFDPAIGITLGTGIGSARSHKGITTDAELSVTPYLDGMAEDYTAIRFFLRRYQELSGQPAKDVRAIAEAVPTDPIAAQVFREFSVHLGVFLRHFIKLDQPQVLVIGGNIANAWPIFEADLRKEVGELFDGVEVRIAALGEAAALIGGACCWQYA
ncbi:ROK family protein [Chitinophaga horti]|uniref:ROK family protein n=1 Tax=Chitinophaga horti TaxID=2920382 RepID=A0ABY6J171_9BACT|nr:ROK family protein [Chitinophaga horti]UYQ93395.1 ROK family protein [Chitinophaga horti]